MNPWALSVLFTALAIFPCAVRAAEAGRDPHARHQRAIAEMEIARLPVTYAWAVDTKDIDLLMSVFSEDIVYDLSAYDFPSAAGKDEVRKVFLTGILPNVRCSFISISNITVEVDGDTASGGDYFVHAGYEPRDRPGNTRSHTEGQHFYEFKLESGAWKISRMRGSPFYEKWESFDPKGLRPCPRAGEPTPAQAQSVK
jgi:ketosteroid isomerase-like protein